MFFARKELRRALNRFFLFFVFLFLYAPVLILIINSFNASKSRIQWGGFTFKWYKLLFQDYAILQAVRNTIFIAIVSSAVATILGTLCCIGIINSNKLFKSSVFNITNVPMVSPEIVTGVSSMLFFVMIYKLTGLFKPGILTLICAHSTFCSPYVFLSVFPKIKQVTPQISEAAQDLGCTPFQAFYKVILPQIMPGIISGVVMSFTMSIDDFTISYFTSGNVQTLPLSIYSMTKKSVSPEINALSTVFFMSILILLIIINIRNEKVDLI